MTSTAVRRRAQAETPAREVQLVNWPLRDTAPLAWLVIGGAAGLGVTISAVTSSTGGGLAAFLALMLAMWRLWAPVRFDLGPDGVTQTVFGRRRHVSWRKIAEFSVTRRGVLLYPAPEELRPMAPRSVYIRGGRQIEQLVEIVSYYVGTSVGRRSPSSLLRAGHVSGGSSVRRTVAAGDSHRSNSQGAGSRRTASTSSAERREEQDREASAESTANPEPPTKPEPPPKPESSAAS